MRFTSNSRLLALTLAMVVGFAASAHAEDPDGQKAEPPPVPDRGTTLQLKCLNENTGYTTSGKSAFYVMTLENKCEARLKCAVFAYTVHAKGPAQGRSTLILAPKSAGAAAKKSYALKVKGVGGFATATRECRVF